MGESEEVVKSLVDDSKSENVSTGEVDGHEKEEKVLLLDVKSLRVADGNFDVSAEKEVEGRNDVPENDMEDVSLDKPEDENRISECEEVTEANGAEEILVEVQVVDPVFDGTESCEVETVRDLLSQPSDVDVDPETETERQGNVWPEKAVALKNFVKEKGAVAVSTVLRRLSGKKDDDEDIVSDKEVKGESFVDGSNLEEDKSSSPYLKDSLRVSGEKKDSLRTSGDRSTWNPLNFIKIGRDADIQNKAEQAENVPVRNVAEEPMKGRIVVYTRLGCQDSKIVRSLLRQKRLKFVEINVDLFPRRKLELEKRTGSSAIPQVYFNDFLVGGLSELKNIEESGKLDEMIKDLFIEEPSPAAPSPPLPGEDDESGSGKVDEWASIVRKMRESIVPKDRFYKMRRFSNCFLGSEAVDFLAEDQYLEREEAVEFGRKLVKKHFFHHVLDEKEFDDGNDLYRFLDHDPVIVTKCYNIPRGTVDVQPKPIVEIATRLRLLSYAIIEAYVSEDGRHVDYKSIHGSEEFKRYLRTIEELQRVDFDISREEKLAFFINIYNMMSIHAILVWGYPSGALDRKKFFGDFKYVIGGCAYSLSAIHNGILRGNQRPPYNLTKPFGPKDRRIKVALPYAEPLVHFALVCGTRSGPALRCYSPGNIDKELMEAARSFIRNGAVTLDVEAKTVSLSKILRWYSVDFGKNEVECLKHAANYLEPAKSEELLELLASTQLRVNYQPYDWGLNILE